MTDLITRISDGRTDLIFEFIDKHEDATHTDSQGVSLLKWCAYYGDVSAIKHLVRHGASLSDLGSNYDLNGAVFHGHWQLSQYLLEMGADPNKKLPDTGETPLHSCTGHANRPVTPMIIELLLAHGADPTLKTDERSETGGFMRDAYTCGETALHRAAAFCDERTIQLLLDAGADKSEKDAHGNSPLGWASWHLRPGNILSLLAYEDHRIHPLHKERMKSDHGAGWGGGMYLNLLGRCHV